MKKLFTLLSAVCSLFAAFGQSYPPEPKIWGTSPFQDSMWSVDPVTFTVEDRLAPSLAGFTITGMNGMAFDPVGYKTYIIAKVSGVSGRVLCTIDLPTGVCTQVGNLGDNFSSLTFRKDGQLFGVTGDGATVPETLYLIDKSNGTKTLAAALGAGADGEVICYNPVDDFIYHWSGNGTVVFEKVLSQPPYTATNIPTTGAAGGETFGALHWNADTFLRSTISSNFNFHTTAGIYSANFGALPDDLRGLVMPPVFAANDDTICNGESITMGAAAITDFSVIYAWGDGRRDTTQAASVTHTYNNAGNYTINVLLSYAGGDYDTFYSKTIRVNAKPIVTLSGPTGICPGGSVTLTGSSGGTSQWYQDGVLISGANTNTYTTSTPGSYNMIKTNQNGCFDSAAVAKVVVNVNNPVVDLGNDQEQCGGAVTLDAANAGAAFSWSTTATTQTINVSATGTYQVTVTDGNNCTATDAVDVVIYDVPVVDLGQDVDQCGGNVALFAANAGATYSWTTNETTQIISVSGSGNYGVTVTNSDGCTASDDVNVTINPVPVVNLGNDLEQCGGTVQLNAGNAGSSYLWSESSTTASITVSATGTYAVTITTSANCTASDEVDVIIYAQPTVDLGVDVEQCGGSVNLDAGTAASYSWSSSENTQAITVSSSAIYAVTITDVNGCTATDEVDVAINTLPTVDLGADVEQCGGSVTLDAGTAVSYSWSNSETTQTVIVSSSAVYAVTVTDANGCTATDETEVTINALPTVDLGVDQFVCGGTVTLDAGAASAYEWSDASTAQTLTVTTGGTYSVTITDANGCTATDDALIGIAPVPTVNLGADVSQCGGSVTLDAGTAASYEWSDASTGQTLVATMSNNYAVTVTNNDGCTATDDVEVVIFAVPVAALNLTTDSLCSDASPLTLGGGTPAGGSYSGAGVSNNVFTPSAPGNVLISYIVVNNDGCADTADATITVYVCTGINQLTSGNVVLYPNPSHNFVTLKTTGIDGRMDVTIADATGRVVELWNGIGTASGFSHTFNLNSYTTGMYLVNVKTTNGTATYNLIVE